MTLQQTRRRVRIVRPIATMTLMMLFCLPTTGADQWFRFRGPQGRGIGASSVADTWNNEQNLKWKVRLPGPGSSSPIVHGDRVFVTCYSGYGVDRSDPGEIENLKRHLLCVRLSDGEVLWSKAIASTQPEDPDRGFITEHGYASSTPVTDGEHVFSFFGKTGVLGFDMEGNQKWQVSVGTESSNRRWGSGASLILYKDSVIVNASEESQSIRALRKSDGKELWKAEASSLELAYTTPGLVTTAGGKMELVVPVPGEVWGLNPDDGQLNWYAETNITGNVTPMVIVDAGIAYVYGGLGGGSVAIRAGGTDDVTESHIVWTSRDTSYVATPLLYDRHLYWVDDRGMVHCVEAATGKEKFRERLSGLSSGGRPCYSSLVLSDGKLYAVSRWDGTYVFEAKPEFKQLTRNVFEGDEGDFNATPAIADGNLLIRSDQYLYCVAE